jgi:RimJ/RimL family protein N-acetyltransferase
MKHKLQLVKFNEYFLESSWNWFLDAELRLLTDTAEFSKEEQLNWFKSLNRKSNYFIWGMLFENHPIGACGIKNCNKIEGEFWGYIGEKSYWGKGIGSLMLYEVEKKAEQIGLDWLDLQVLKVNTKAKRLYDKNGYKIEKEDNNFFYMRKKLILSKRD